jgi:hypothetical protein
MKNPQEIIDKHNAWKLQVFAKQLAEVEHQFEKNFLEKLCEKKEVIRPLKVKFELSAFTLNVPFWNMFKDELSEALNELFGKAGWAIHIDEYMKPRYERQAEKYFVFTIDEIVKPPYR